MKQDWQAWIERLGNKELSEQELCDFQRALQENPDGMDGYMQALLTETCLETEGRPLAGVDSRPAPAVLPSAPGRARRWKKALPAAAALALMAGISYFIGARQAVPAAPPSAAFQPVATVTDTNPVADQAGIRIGKQIGAGEFQVPEHAEIGLAMGSGARLQINGPAAFRIESEDKVFLRSGRIETYAPEYARGFSIDTKEGRIIDLGTRFVATSGTDAGTEIHVIEGVVKARTAGGDKKTHFIGGEQAVILNKGVLSSTDFLAHRLSVPLNPELTDLDGDQVPDVVEMFYRTEPGNAKSSPDTLRIYEPFDSYIPGPLGGVEYKGKGKTSAWMGKANVLPNGLSYQKDGMTLKTSGGCLQTVGEKEIGATIIPDASELPDSGTVYISFLMQQPGRESLADAFSGILLYRGDYKEELFTGEIHPANSYGSRFAASPDEDAFAVKPDDNVHLFVIRIDRTRKLTDVFIDPPLHKPPKDLLPTKRYQAVPDFDRISVRSGSDRALFPVLFDELRVGLTWRSVLPVQ